MTPTDPAPPEPAIQVAARLLAEGRPAEAAQRLAALVASAPIYAAAHVLRATALEAAGSVDQAIVSWGRAAALVPRSPLVHRERARLLATRLAEEPPPDLPAAEPARPPAPDAHAFETVSPRSPASPEEGLESSILSPEERAALDSVEIAADVPDGAGEAGWNVLGEVDVPTPPPATTSEPDVVAPERAASPVDDDLDALITQLADAPRIRPDPDYAGTEVSLDTGDVDDMASETLAKIYAAQHQYAQAALVYETLAARQPDQADALLERAAELRQRRR